MKRLNGEELLKRVQTTQYFIDCTRSDTEKINLFDAVWFFQEGFDHANELLNNRAVEFQEIKKQITLGVYEGSIEDIIDKVLTIMECE